MTRRRRLRRWLVIAIVALLAIGSAAPFLNAGRFRQRITSALQQALGRRVEIGAVHLKLLPSPGFSLGNVRIYDDPAFGIEPAAYVTALEARPRFWSLWNGRLEFASLRLEDPSVNLVRVERANGSVHWNFEELVAKAAGSRLPSIHVRGGRINFKFGETKSLFYFNNTDLDISPPLPGSSEWTLAFSGEPDRTDRAARPFGTLTAKGRWEYSRTSEGRLNLDVQLERTALSELSALIHGRDVGIHGQVISRARISGPIRDLQITGRFELEDLHRWDLLPPRGQAWPIDFRGRLNLPGQRLELESQPLGTSILPLFVRFRVSDYLSQPRWALAVNWNRFPIQPLLQIARHLGMRLPVDFKLAGTIDGAVGYSGSASLQGSIALHDSVLSMPNAPAIHFRQAQLVVDGGRVRLAPALARTSQGDEGKLEGEYSWPTQEFNLRISTDSMRVAPLRSELRLFEQFTAGAWSGALVYQRNSDGSAGWTGRIQLKRVEIPVPGFSGPLRIESARAHIDGARLVIQRLRGSVGKIAFQGEYRYEPQLNRPHRFRVSIPELDAAELERVMLPSLDRRRGFLARTLGLGRVTVPDWLKTRHAEGAVQVDSLTIADQQVLNLRARVLWNGSSVELVKLEGRLEQGSVKGRLAVDLRAGTPSYRLVFLLNSAQWRGGLLDVDAVLQTSGIGPDLLAHLHSEGSFSGRGLELGPDTQAGKVSGCYQLDWSPRAPHLRFTDLQLMVDDDLYIGRGATQEDGRLTIELTHGAKRLRMSGTLAQLRVDEN